jgi:hypothetical protein
VRHFVSLQFLNPKAVGSATVPTSGCRPLLLYIVVAAAVSVVAASCSMLLRPPLPFLQIYFSTLVLCGMGARRNITRVSGHRYSTSSVPGRLTGRTLFTNSTRPNLS